MRKVLSILSLTAVMILVGCNCLAQNPPDQLLYLDVNCEATLPDYTNDVIVTDNCDGFTIAQVPAPGTILSSTTNVVVSAVDVGGNVSSINFNVVLLDTISPVIIPGPGLSLNETDEMYDNFLTNLTETELTPLVALQE